MNTRPPIQTRMDFGVSWIKGVSLIYQFEWVCLPGLCVHSHGFGWVSHRFMCLTVTDLDGSLINSNFSQSWIWMDLS